MHDHQPNDHYHRGEMDISQHKDFYSFFGNMTKWGSLVLAVALVFLVLLTCVPGAGLIGAGFAGIMVAIIGFFIMK
jgi:hypothetical protein